MATALVVGLVGIAGAILGALGQHWLGRQVRAEERRQQLADDADRRIREWRVRRIEETRHNLAEIFDGLSALTSRDLNRARALRHQALTRLLAEDALVGDVEALRAGAEAIARVIKKTPRGVIQTTISQVKWPLDTEDRRALSKARRLLIHALIAQEERALRNEPLNELSVDEAAEIMAILKPPETATRS